MMIKANMIRPLPTIPGPLRLIQNSPTYTTIGHLPIILKAAIRKPSAIITMPLGLSQSLL
jgi:hypothetical protein